MGVNRIVMQSGVVWWLAPPRKRRGAAGRAASGPQADGPPVDDGPRASRDPAALPPDGFIPLSSLGLPGIDAMLGGHADLYRQAYERAMRDIEESRGRAGAGGDASPGLSGPPPADTPG